MADIPRRRGFALGTRGVPGAPVVQIPLAASQSGYPGYLVTYSSGAGNIVQSFSADDGSLLGVLESRHSSSAAGDVATVSLFVPGAFWEFSADSTTTASMRGMSVAFTDPGGDYEFTTVDTTSGHGFVIAFFASDQGVYETNRFIAGNATSETAGASNTPQADLGVPGDKYARVIGTAELSSIVLAG